MIAELCLSLALYHEARGEPLNGQRAVAEVIMNRVESDRFPDTICGVVMQPNQFSFVSPNGWAGIPTDGDLWADAEMFAQDAIFNHKAGEKYWGGYYYHYHATSVSPVWAEEMYPAMTIGSHVFYSDNLTKPKKVRPKLRPWK